MVNTCMREADPGLQVVAAIEPDEAGLRDALPEPEREHVRFCETVDQLAAHVDAIAIGTRCNLHASYASQVAATGLPLFLEKPVAITFDDAKALELAFCQSKSEVVVSFPLRASPLCRRVKQLLEQGIIGIPEQAVAVNYVPYGDVYFNSWYRDYAVTGGLFLQKATHDFDYLSYCLHSPIVRVMAMKSCGRVYRDASLAEEGNPNCAYFEDIGSPEEGMNEDSSSALLEFANGVHATYTQVFYAKRNAAARGATFSGYRGTLKFDWCRSEASIFHHLEPYDDTIKVDDNLHHHGGDGVLAENFIKVIRGESRSISSIWHGLSSVYACLAARESTETLRCTEVNQLKDNSLVEQTM